MPSRRHVLATTVGATALAGCVGANSPDGIPSTFSSELISIPDDATVAAREEVELSDGPGLARGTASVYERTADHGPPDLLLVTEYRILPQDDGVQHAAFQAVHDWTVGEVPGPVRSHSSNVVPTDEDDPPLSVEDKSSTNQGRWYVHLTPPKRRPVTYRFLTLVQSTGLSEGDLLAEANGKASFEEEGLFTGGNDVETVTSLAYGASSEP